MSLLEKVMYLADYIEPTRDFPGVDELREDCAMRTWTAALLLGLEMTVEEMHRAWAIPCTHATLEARDCAERTERTREPR